MQLGQSYFLQRPRGQRLSTLRYESKRFDSIVERVILTLHRIKEALRKKFANIANNFERRLQDLSNELSALEGPLEAGQSPITT